MHCVFWELCSAQGIKLGLLAFLIYNYLIYNDLK